MITLIWTFLAIWFTGIIVSHKVAKVIQLPKEDRFMFILESWASIFTLLFISIDEMYRMSKYMVKDYEEREDGSEKDKEDNERK